MRWIYTLFAYLAAPVFCAVLWFRGLRDRRYWRNFGERFGRGPTPDRPSIWVHAVSVGEVQAAAVLVRNLHERYAGIPLVVTTLSAMGDERARTLLGERAIVRYMPLDLPGAVRRFFNQVKPRIAVIFETELWPNLYYECGRRRVPLVLASARLSPRAMGRYRSFLTLFRQVLSHGIIAAQGEDDAARFRSLGADPERTHVTGNLKFDFALPANVTTKGRELRQLYAADRPVWVAGSTHGGEEELVLEAHRAVRRVHPRALLVLAPRHPLRFAEVGAWLEKQNVRIIRRSNPSSARTPDLEVLLVDTMGELLDFYAMGDVAFVGGSLVTVGGHNLLEPAALGVPVLAGPHNFNSADIAKILVDRGAAQIVKDSTELGARVAALLSDPAERERIGALARASVEDNRGALEKLLSLIDPLLRQ
jgi:3-deoxy-D-manno-octulosonic-acid transferase